MNNPVLGRELGAMIRSWRVSLVLFILAVMVGGMVLLHLAAAGNGQGGGGLPTRTGIQLFSLLAAFQLGLVMLLAPGLTVGAISGERERRTLEPLFHTGLSASVFVLGKLGAALAYILLILVALAPAMGVLMLMGGTTPKQLLLVYAVLVVTGLLQSTMGLFTSALSRRTQSAATAAYVITAVLTVLSVLPTWLAGPALTTWGVKPQFFLANAMVSPVTALAASTGGPLFSPILATVVAPSAAQTSGGGSQQTATFSGFVPAAYSGLQQASQGATVQMVRTPLPLVTYGYLAFSGGAVLLMLVVSIWAVRPHGRKFRLFRPRKGVESPG